jgi:hypothetical protein
VSPADAAATGWSAERLGHLNDLYEQGLLSQAKYDWKRQEIIGQM